jgi:hypothetical protein
MHVTTDAEQTSPLNNSTNSNYGANASSIVEARLDKGFLNERPKRKGADAPPAYNEAAKNILEYTKANMPDYVDWRNVNGTNFLTWTRTQINPFYCGSCWATSVASALGDRFNIWEWKVNGAHPSSPIVLNG